MTKVIPHVLSRPLRVRAAAATTAVSVALIAALAGPTSTSASTGDLTPALAAKAAAKQKTFITVLPPVSQPGKKAAKSKKAKSVVTASFTPAKKNRPVTLFVKSGGGFKKVASTKLTKDGFADFTVQTKKGATYKATAAAYKGLAATSTKTAKNTWKKADFTDEFGGSTLGSAWSYRANEYNPQGLRNCAKGDPAAVGVAKGDLRLSVQLDPARAAEKCTAKRADGSTIGQFSYRLNGHVSTQGRYDFRYGVAAARIKFQKLRGQHASFWLQPTVENRQATTAKAGGSEIDVIEWFGTGGKQSGLTSFIYHPSKKGPVKVGGFLKQQDRFLSSKKDDWWKQYHVFSVEWTKKYYIFRIDGKVSAIIDSTQTSGVAQYPILSMLSSDYELPDLPSEKDLPQTSYVDWIQVWES